MIGAAGDACQPIAPWGTQGVGRAIVIRAEPIPGVAQYMGDAREDMILAERSSPIQDRTGRTRVI